MKESQKCKKNVKIKYISVGTFKYGLLKRYLMKKIKKSGWHLVHLGTQVLPPIFCLPKSTKKSNGEDKQ